MADARQVMDPNQQEGEYPPGFFGHPDDGAASDANAAAALPADDPSPETSPGTADAAGQDAAAPSETPTEDQANPWDDPNNPYLHAWLQERQRAEVMQQQAAAQQFQVHQNLSAHAQQQRVARRQALLANLDNLPAEQLRQVLAQEFVHSDQELNGTQQQMTEVVGWYGRQQALAMAAQEFGLTPAEAQQVAQLPDPNQMRQMAYQLVSNRQQAQGELAQLRREVQQLKLAQQASRRRQQVGPVGGVGGGVALPDGLTAGSDAHLAFLLSGGRG